MFSIDRWHEILDTLWRNKLRSALTAFSMAWGIFMLVALLGLGNALHSGVQNRFADDATNAIWMFGGQTTKPHEGLPIGRRVTFENKDVDTVKAMDGVGEITGRFWNRGGGPWGGGDLQVRNGAKVSSFDVRAVHPGHLYLEKTIIVAGRWLNDGDVAEKRKVAVVGKPVAAFLFGDADPMGAWIQVGRVSFQVVGVFDDEGGESELKKIYVPITAAQLAWNGAERVNQIMFIVENTDVDASKALAQEVKGKLAEAHDFAPDDPQAVRIRNNVENFESFQKIFRMIRYFVWAMGIAALIAGIVGVSNIMMIVVRERTKEIGIRKALGATPSNIVTSIVQEAIFLTAVAGYLGLIAGVGGLSLLESVIPPNDAFGAPRVDLGVALWATLILVVAGALAGYFPARAAAKVNPIVALRDE